MQPVDRFVRLVPESLPPVIAHTGPGVEIKRTEVILAHVPAADSLDRIAVVTIALNIAIRRREVDRAIFGIDGQRPAQYAVGRPGTGFALLGGAAQVLQLPGDHV